MAPSISARQRSVATGMHQRSNGMSPSVGTNANSSSSGHVTIVGGGLVGSMASCFLARRGYQVDMYEMRKDPREQEVVLGKSINLALSERGRSALRVLGLEQEILDKYSIKMYARMIHDLNGNRRAIPYGRDDQCILSVSRRFLNERLISEAEKLPNVKCHFEHKMVDANLEEGTVIFQRPNNGKNEQEEEINTPETVQSQADVIIGCDGAYSAVRRNIQKKLLLDYSQKYIEHGYIELCIHPTEKGEYAMEQNYLHIWPRGSFMMIALPNLDHSFTVTLFMPFKRYDEIKNEAQLMQFFRTNFPDSIPLLTEEGICKSFFAGKPSALISIKCSPYNFKDKVLLMGDAAHAMVPFYGQGMNCGFEDCVVLDELLEKYGNTSLPMILDKYTKNRIENCHTIIDLAMYNYEEMRDHVNKLGFLVRKKFDNTMYSLFPSFWAPLYTMVTFTRTPYKKCMADRRWQDDVLKNTGKYLLILFGLFFLLMLSKYFETTPTLNPSFISK